MKLTVLTGVNPINYEYYYYFIDNLRKTTSNETQLHVKVITGPARGRGDLVLNDRQVRAIENTNVEVVRGDHLPNVGHSLNHLMSIDEQHEGDFTLISDIDVAIIKKDWDKDVMPLFKDFDVIGIPHEETKTFELGNGANNAHRPHGSPTIIWMIFKNNSIWKNLDFTHSKDEEHCISEEESKLYNIPANSYLAKDIGWKIPKFLQENNIKSHCLINLNRHSLQPRRIFADVPENLPWGDGTNKQGWPCDEGYLGEIPLMLHQKLSQRWVFKQSNVSKVFYDKADEILA